MIARNSSTTLFRGCFIARTYASTCSGSDFFVERLCFFAIRCSATAGFVPTAFNFGRLDVYFIGETNWEYFEKAGYYLLGCSCGEVDCWPLTARISKTQSQVVWDRFRQPHRLNRDYSSFGPFKFDLHQYRHAIVE